MEVPMTEESAAPAAEEGNVMKEMTLPFFSVN